MRQGREPAGASTLYQRLGFVATNEMQFSGSLL